MRIGVIFVSLFIFLFALEFISATPLYNDLHVNIQVTYANGTIQTGTFGFMFNISSTSDCSSVVYSNSSTLTTNSQGQISYYIPNVVLSNYSQQYWLCYYRDGVLSGSSEIAGVPYSFYANYVPPTGILNTGNISIPNYNVSANYFIGNGSLLTNVPASEVLWNGNFSNFSVVYGYATNGTFTSGGLKGVGSFGYIPMWNSTNQLNNSAIYQNGSNIGIGTTTPSNTLEVDGVGLFNTSNNQVRLVDSDDNKVWSLNANIGDFSIRDATNNKVALRIDNQTGSVDTALEIGGTGNVFLVQNGGEVGINTSTPQNTLNVIGDLNVTGTIYGNLSVTSSNGVWNQSGGSVYLSNPSWKVGIGSINPTALLNLNGTGKIAASSNILEILAANQSGVSGANASIFLTGGNDQFSSSTRGVEIMGLNTGGSNNAHDLLFFTNDGGQNISERMRITSGGLVGINTSTPFGILDINESTNGNGTVIQANSSIVGDTPRLGFTDTFASNENSSLIWYIDNYQNNFRIYQQPNMTSSGSSVALFINASNGDVGINTSTPQTTLNVVGSINATNTVFFGTNGSEADSDQGGSIELGLNNINKEKPYIDFHYGQGAVQDYNFRIINNGNNSLGFLTGNSGNVLEINDSNISVKGNLNVSGEIGSSGGYVDGGGPNLITVAGTSFENAKIGWFARNGQTSTRNNTLAHSGNWSLASLDVSAGNQMQTYISGLEYLANNSGNYVATAWVYVPSAGGMTGAHLVYRDGGSNFFTGGTVYTSASITTLDSWQELVLPFSATSTSGDGFLVIYGEGANNGNYMYIDDVQIQRGSVPTAYSPFACDQYSNCTLADGNFSVAGNTFFVSGIGNGVGIGTITPADMLEVDSGATAAVARFVSANTANNESFIDINNSNNNTNLRLGIFNGGFPGIASGVGTTPTITLIDTNVGIGTTTPQNVLNVLGDINATTSIFAQRTKNLSIGYDYATNGSLVQNGTTSQYNLTLSIVKIINQGSVALASCTAGLSGVMEHNNTGLWYCNDTANGLWFRISP